MNETKRNPIDLVIPWVDGGDPAWRAERVRYSKEESSVLRTRNVSGDSDARFRDWGLLPYLFRGIERNMPWIRTVHFITWGHLPPWLDTSCPRLNIVRHEDYIPREFLPTFSSRPIDMNLHRIPELAECFVYFNDDMFPILPISEDFYFRNGIPRDYAVQNARSVTYDDRFYTPLIDDAVINRHFPKRATIRAHCGKWFSPCYGIFNLVNLAFLNWSTFTGFVDSHLPIAYTKSQFRAVWESEPELLTEVCSHRFRRHEDINQWLIRYWRLCTGDFIPKKCEPLDAMFAFELDEADMLNRCAEAIRSGKRRLICINDGSKVTDFERDKAILHEAFEARFPEKSLFERA